MMTRAADGLREQWVLQIGSAEVENLETHLAALVGALPEGFDSPGWMAQNEVKPA